MPTADFEPAVTSCAPTKGISRALTTPIQMHWRLAQPFNPSLSKQPKPVPDMLGCHAVPPFGRHVTLPVRMAAIDDKQMLVQQAFALHGAEI
jgi:hypothetical protein